MTTIKVIDFESTGGFQHPRPVEVGVIQLDETGKVTKYYDQLINPHQKIDLDAMVVHNITDEMVKGKPSFDDIVESCLADILIAHNVQFDKKVLELNCPEYLQDKVSKIIWIDTLKLCRTHYPEAPKHSNMYMFYWLGLHKNFKYDGVPHRTGFDAAVTTTIVRHFCNKFNCEVSELKKYESKPFNLQKCPYKKYKGTTWEEVLSKDMPYVKWLVSNVEFKDKDLKEWLQNKLN